MDMSEHEEQWLTKHGAEMVSTLGVNESNSVIDFGCGKGRYTIPLSQITGESGQVFAVERDAQELDVLRDRMNRFGKPDSVKILESEDIRLQSINDSSIDQMLVFDVLQYIEDHHQFFQSVRRVLKPNGQIHIYPAAIPHPGAVDMTQVDAALTRSGLVLAEKNAFRMMHNKDIVHDEVHTFRLPRTR